MSVTSLLKLAGCNIYGRMYRVGRIITELSGPCLECRCTEIGVQCKQLKCWSRLPVLGQPVFLAIRFVRVNRFTAARCVSGGKSWDNWLTISNDLELNGSLDRVLVYCIITLMCWLILCLKEFGRIGKLEEGKWKNKFGIIFYGYCVEMVNYVNVRYKDFQDK